MCQQYDRIADAYDRSRNRGLSSGLMERPYLQTFSRYLPPAASVLDLGCGSGRPIAQWLIRQGCAVTGVDGAPRMLEMCQARFPKATWVQADMRALDLPCRFNGIVAWDSFFHLDPGSQREMFPIFGAHMEPGAILLFTSGHEAGEISNPMHGEDLYHASLDPSEYRALLSAIGCEVLLYRERDPDCGGHTVWLARNG